MTTIAFHHSKASNTWGVEGGVRVKVSVTPKIQLNLSIEDAIGTQLAVLYREVSLIQRYVRRCVHSSMWLGQQTVTSSERCPL